MNDTSLATRFFNLFQAVNDGYPVETFEATLEAQMTIIPLGEEKEIIFQLNIIICSNLWKLHTLQRQWLY